MNATESTVTARHIQRKKTVMCTREIREGFQVEVRLELGSERWGDLENRALQNQS